MRPARHTFCLLVLLALLPLMLLGCRGQGGRTKGWEGSRPTATSQTQPSGPEPTPLATSPAPKEPTATPTATLPAVEEPTMCDVMQEDMRPYVEEHGGGVDALIQEEGAAHGMFSGCTAEDDADCTPRKAGSLGPSLPLVFEYIESFP